MNQSINQSINRCVRNAKFIYIPTIYINKKISSMGSNSSKSNSGEKPKTKPNPISINNTGLPDLNESFHGDEPKPSITPENEPTAVAIRKQLS